MQGTLTSLQHPLPQVGVEAIRRLVHRIEHTYEGDPEVRALIGAAPNSLIRL